MATSSRSLPKLPYAEFPLRPHRNGQWYKSVWNPRVKKSELRAKKRPLRARGRK